jgi:hypothetical protein
MLNMLAAWTPGALELIVILAIAVICFAVPAFIIYKIAAFATRRVCNTSRSVTVTQKCPHCGGEVNMNIDFKNSQQDKSQS